MKCFLICVLLGVLAIPALFQTTKPKPKPAAGKQKAAATPAKKPVAAKPKSSPKRANEQEEWERVTTIQDRPQRIAALEKFVTTFPKGSHVDEASGLIAAARVEAGNDALAASNVDSAVAEYKAAVARVPSPVVKGFWDDGLIKIPANLYFRDRREAALDIAKALESKAGNNVEQLLGVARFYLTIENGTEGKRLSEKAVEADPNSAAAYRSVGLAERVQFRLEQSAAAFQKALEIEPDSIEARQGLAEMQRAFGKPSEALALYDAVIEKQPENIGAQTGRIMALFESGRRAEAEAAMTKSLEAAPGNVLLLAGAAYWYAAQKDGSKAVEFGKKAIEQEPRFIWGHIAYARGLLLQGRAGDAEAALLAARRYGNFPTLEYEIAVARAAGGFFREAAEGLAPVFRSKDGVLTTELGNRVPRESRSFTELVGDERRATIFAPTAADDPGTAARLASLLEFQQQISAAAPDEASVAKAADDLVRGDDPMAVHRKLYAASTLLENKIALSKAAELAKGAVADVDRGLDTPAASTAVMAGELYTPRRIAATSGDYVNVPVVPRATLSAILRGRIEDMLGWTAYQNGSAEEAILHLRRAVAVLPPDSAWWRSSSWHLGAALAVAGKDSEALDQYIKSYKSDKPDAIRYSVIEALYRKVNGSANGLAEKIGENPAQGGNRPVAPVVPPPTEPLPNPTPASSGSPTAEPSPTPDIPVASAPAVEVKAEAAPVGIPVAAEPSPSPGETPSSAAKTAEVSQGQVASQGDDKGATPKSPKTELFPPVIITVRAHSGEKDPTAPTEGAANASSPDATQPGTVTPCEVTVSEDAVTLSGGDRSLIVGRSDDGTLDGLDAKSSSPTNVAVRRQPIAGVVARALYVLKATGRRGVYQVTFILPCGSRLVTVNVR